jgi:hypothetical protein
MGLLAGEDVTLLQGDIDNLKNDFESFKITHCSDHYEEAGKLYPRLNIIEEQLRLLQSFMDNLDDRITNVENFLGAFYNYNESEKTNNFS